MLVGHLRPVLPRHTFVKLAQYRETFWSYSTVFKKLFHSAEYMQDALRGNDEVLHFAKPQKMKYPLSFLYGLSRKAFLFPAV